MLGSVFAAGVPLLGPAVAACIALIVGVMAFYFLSPSRQYRSRGVVAPPEWRRPTSIQAQPGNGPAGSPWMPPVSFRSDVRQAGFPVVQPERELAAYDMENLPGAK
ncbi:MAG: hypothetical protein M3083_13550 [Actinomycetota bacterium]|nr:hypothetical protein [Actinomycetota bacterium]